MTELGRIKSCVRVDGKISMLADVLVEERRIHTPTHTMMSKGRVVQNEWGETQIFADHGKYIETKGYHGAPGERARMGNFSKCGDRKWIWP